MLRYLWRRLVAERITQSLAARLAPDLEGRIASAMAARCALMRTELLDVVESKMSIAGVLKPWKANLYIPTITLQGSADAPFMAHSTCSASDFLHPEFARLSGVLGIPLTFHRKYWEWVFVLHHALRSGAVAPGKRALGFAVGWEPLPAAFARFGATVTATDAPEEIGLEKGWQKDGQHAVRLEDLYRPEVVDRETFDEQVTFSACDMTCIPSDYVDYDFCWSSCSFEHLGNLAAGVDFVVESVEKTLRVGGIACHTTELNLTSDEDTVQEGPTVLYRKQDLLKMIDLLERRGHLVEPFSIARDTHVLDSFVDTPPYQAPPHLKLRLLGYVSTSVGLIIHRGR
jgi:hypothetical protein